MTLLRAFTFGGSFPNFNVGSRTPEPTKTKMRAPTLKFRGTGRREFQKGLEVEHITWLNEGMDYLDRGVC